MTTAVAVGVVSLLATAPLSAQTCNTNPCTVAVTASATVNTALQLTLSATTTDLGTPSVADYNTGYKDAAGPTATVKSNTPWTLNVVGNTATFSGSGGARANKPAADLLWGKVAGTYANNMSAVAALNSGNGTLSSAQQIFFRTNWDYATDTPGTYSLVVNFTLSAP
ncbi:MAG TPA: hypothetical protein VGT98_15750 [Candidatus Elarobacter sp.]|nr:hypothetical protein [Candidatus Elarobacter sp.]